MRIVLLSALLGVGGLGGASLATSDPLVPPHPAAPQRTSETKAPEAADTEGGSLVDPYSETVFVTSALIATDVERLPVSVDVIHSDEIEARQATSVAELLATVSGLTMARSGSPGQVASLFTRGTESDHTLVLWNGIELNNPYFGGFNWAFQPTQGLSRVEVARGPFSALYGSDAVGGVVQMISGHRDGFGLRVEGGGDGYSRAAVELGLAGDSVQFDLFGHTRRGDGTLDNDFYDSDELVARLEWKPTDGAWLGFVIRANDSETGIPLSGGVPSPERRIAWEEREVAVPIRYERGDWQFDAQLAQVEYDNRFSDPGDTFGFTESDTQSESFRARVVAQRRLGGGRIAFGGETERLEVDDRSVFGVNLEGAEQTTEALFAEWHHEAGRWAFDVGVRFDDNDVYGSETSPRFAVVREIGTHGRLFASYGESFRAPSIGELFFPFSGNADLRPEIGESSEIGYSFSHDGWEFRIAGFENRLTDLIDFDFVTFTNINVGEARTRGLEVSVAYAAPTWSVRWNGTSLDAEDRVSGLDLLRRPSESSNLVVTWSRDRWKLSGVARYVAERPDVDPVTFSRAMNGSYATADIAAHWRWNDRVSPYARVENVLDREYQEVLGFPSPGTTWIGGIAFSH